MSESLIDKVEKFLEHNGLLRPENTFLIGFSGGYDSTALLSIMASLSAKYKFCVVAMHLNHNWRKEAIDEQKNCEYFCKNFGINLIVDTLKDTKKTEDEARKARYKFFMDCAKKFKNSYVMTAHNFEDNAETVLYRLAKGTGIRGLCAIPEVNTHSNITILRPLLGCRRKDIEAFCKDFKINQDSSNNDTHYKRNLIRLKILPLLEEINPCAIQAINSLSEIAKSDIKIIDYATKQAFVDDKILKEKFDKMPNELKREIIYEFLIKSGIEPDKRKILEISDFLSQNNIQKKYSLESNKYLTFDEKFIYTTTPQKMFSDEVELKVTGEGDYEFKGGIFSIKKIEKVEKYPKDEDYEAIVNLPDKPLTIRTRRRGDFIQPFGMDGKMKLKKYLISKKIPEVLRDEIVLLCCESEVFWVSGVGLSDKLKVVKHPSHVLKYNKKW